MLGRRVSAIRAGFYACLVPFLLVQLWFAASKLRDGRPGTVIARNSNPTVRLPAVLFCANEKKVPERENDTLVSLHERAKDIEMIVKLAYFRDQEYKLHNMLDKTSLRTNFGASYEEVWRETYLYKSMPPRMLIKCWILKQFLDVVPALSEQVVLGTDSRPFISFHEEHQFVWPFSELLGNVPYVAGMTSPANSKNDIRVGRRHTTRLSKEGRAGGCSEDNNEELQLCLQEYIQRTLNCMLPWLAKGTGRVCDTREDLNAYARIVTRVGSTTSQLEDILQATGCQTNCRTVKYSARRFNLYKNVTAHTNFYYFSLAMPQTSTVEEKEVVTYDWNNFIADVGGLLGLLLGVSIMDLAAFFEGMAAKTKTDRRQRPKT